MCASGQGDCLHLSKVDGALTRPPPVDDDGIGGMVAAFLRMTGLGRERDGCACGLGAYQGSPSEEADVTCS